MQDISSRWLLKILPWVQVSGGTYRVNRRLTYSVGEGQLGFTNVGDDVRVIPQTLVELPLLRGLTDQAILTSIAESTAQQEFAPGEIVVSVGEPADRMFLIAHGKATKLTPGKFGNQALLGLLRSGGHFGAQVLLEPESSWEYTVKADTACTVLTVPRRAFQELLGRSGELRSCVEVFRAIPQQAQNRHGEAEIEVAAGHDGEPELPGAFADYEPEPREYALSVAQTILQVHTRVADLYNDPMNQTQEQLRLTIEALRRERQEHEMVNNHHFGLLHNADLKQRIHTRTGPPTPDDMDELLSMRRKTQFFLAHPRAIAAFGRECNHRGLYPTSADLNGNMVPAWRGVPVLPCNKIPVHPVHRTSSIIALRTGEEDQGVIGLHQAGIPDEVEPSLSVRFMGINEKAVISYLVSAYYSAAILVPRRLRHPGGSGGRAPRRLTSTRARGVPSGASRPGGQAGVPAGGHPVWASQDRSALPSVILRPIGPATGTRTGHTGPGVNCAGPRSMPASQLCLPSAPQTELNSPTTSKEKASRWSVCPAGQCVSLLTWAISVACPDTGS